MVDIDEGQLGLRSYGFDLVTTTPALHLLSTWEPHHIGISRRSVNVHLGDTNNEGACNRAETLEGFRCRKGGADDRRNIHFRNDNMTTLEYDQAISDHQLLESEDYVWRHFPVDLGGCRRLGSVVRHFVTAFLSSKSKAAR